ncbi:rhomboid family intramembrane serine protease [Neptunitalea lumnitzerae]|uniref:Rhomboid family intramembrane serine protease n=1 Tax=Neptunitalea lumnitzerae TaxID=2965509 RepID=A0ABQ5MLT6_9FLAO|nr:rhomboid family intramembrane serine protease [Neptunitalea sp. Y10]GLB50376.1 rhomboid family intramembrane serine protease [Neptunitalea sp. Y10]
MQNSLGYKYSMLAPSGKMIVINVAVFIVMSLAVFLFQLEVPGTYNVFERWLGLFSNPMVVLTRPWSLLTYSFLHGSIMHLLGNMLVLYFTGNIFLNLFNGKQFYNVYLLGALAGGLLYVLSYNLFPVFSGKNIPLVGASASVMAILIFVCTYTPNLEVRLFGMFTLKLWYIGAFLVVMDLLSVSVSNPGGHIAHLGGALFGFIYAKQLQQGTDIGAWFSNLMDGIANLFKGTSGNGGKKAKFKKVYRNKGNQSSKDAKVFNNDKNIHQKKIDAILDKISKSGYDSLTKEEKDYLFRAGKNN